MATFFVAELCNGSTADSDSVCLGSNPSSAASMAVCLCELFYFKVCVDLCRIY